MDLNNLNIDLITLFNYEEKGLIVKQSHPSLPLYVWNYTRTCQYESKWDEVTLNCRSLITDFDGNIISKGFSKFFNLEEHKDNEIPNEPFDVYEKLDGSYIGAFYYENQWIIHSKGSFISEQAIAASKYFFKNNYDKLFDTKLTLIFEYVGINNRIVCNYPFEENLILIGLFNKDNEINIDQLKLDNNINIVKKYDGINDFKTLRDVFNGDNREGFVIRFKSGFRIKIKYNEYVRLHRIINNITSYDIWEHLKSGNDIESLLENVPDEFDQWVRNIIDKLNNNYINTSNFYYSTYNEIINNIISTDKKTFALEAKKYPNNSLLFYINNGKNISDKIWDIIKPKFEKSFKN